MATDSRLMQRLSGMSALKTVIAVNIAVFVLLRMADFSAALFGARDAAGMLRWVEMPSDPALLLQRPWTVVTYMFSQYEVWHILLNMLWLFWFGAIFTSLFREREFTALYFVGGLGGALLYLLACNVIAPLRAAPSFLIGSSASVIAIVAATAIRVPDYKMSLLLIGSVSLKWVALATIAIDLVSVGGANAGGHIAHLGGALAGAIWALAMRRRARRVRSRRRTAPGPRKTSAAEATDEEQLDALLDKIKMSGYTSLTGSERRRLLELSQRLRSK